MHSLLLCYIMLTYTILTKKLLQYVRVSFSTIYLSSISNRSIEGSMMRGVGLPEEPSNPSRSEAYTPLSLRHFHSPFHSTEELLILLPTHTVAHTATHCAAAAVGISTGKEFYILTTRRGVHLVQNFSRCLRELTQFFS